MNDTNTDEKIGTPMDNFQVGDLQERYDTLRYEHELLKGMVAGITPMDGSAESILRIWANCLNNMLYPKAHFIDALGKTTRRLNGDKERAEQKVHQLQRELGEAKAELATIESYKIKELADSYNNKGVIEHNLLGYERAFVLAGDYHQKVGQLHSQLTATQEGLRGLVNAGHEISVRLYTTHDDSAVSLSSPITVHDFEAFEEALTKSRALLTNTKPIAQEKASEG